MNKASLALIIVAGLVVAAAGCTLIPEKHQNTFDSPQATSPSVIGDKAWTAGMGWRYVAYIEKDKDVSLSLVIEPMVKGNDLVYVPNESTWMRDIPSWARERRSEILDRLKSVAWNRKLTWKEGEYSVFVSGLDSDTAVPGSLESTRGGRELEDRRMFEPGSKYTHDEAHKIWHESARMYSELAKGEVKIFTGGKPILKDSVFEAIELPTLKKNPNVTLIFR